MTSGVDRRRVLAIGAAAAAFGGAARAQAVQAVALATTTNGPVRGVQADGLQTFKGVRYGAPPVGPLPGGTLPDGTLTTGGVGVSPGSG